MFSHVAAQDSSFLSPRRPATSLLRRFNALYKPTTSAGFSFLTSRKPKKKREVAAEVDDQNVQPVHVPFFNLHHGSQTNLFVDSESSSSHSHSDVASSSRHSLDSLPPSLRTGNASPLPSRPPTKPLRPALKQNSIRKSASTRPVSHDLHVSFAIPDRHHVPDAEPEQDPTSFALHPLFAYTHLDHAPISYDVAFAPCQRAVLDRATRAPIPHETLDEPATRPACYNTLTLVSPLLPWPIVVRPAPPQPQGPGPTTPRRRQQKRNPITNRDVLHALYSTLQERATDTEWAALRPRSRAQRRVARAYEQRCVVHSGGWEAGVRRIDWLDGRTRLVGIIAITAPIASSGKGEAETASTVARLVFKSPV